MANEAVDLAAKLSRFTEHWSPKVIARLNDYEIKLGTFKNALPIGVDHFRDFPAAVRKLPPRTARRPES